MRKLELFIITLHLEVFYPESMYLVSFPFHTNNSPFYSCVLGCQAFEQE